MTWSAPSARTRSHFSAPPAEPTRFGVYDTALLRFVGGTFEDKPTKAKLKALGDLDPKLAREALATVEEWKKSPPDEKFKKQKNGNIHRHVYYGCTKARGADCKCGYTEEKEILKQFEELIDRINLNEIEVKEKIKTEK